VSEGHRVFALAYGWLGPRADAAGTAEHRARLLAPAAGRVVEVGAGTGLNIRHYPSQVTEVLATEPDPNMYRRLARALGAARVPTRLRRAPADDLPVPDGWADAVVCSLVLCSVPDPPAALAEARRILRPGGELLFFEHVRAPAGSRLGRWQDRLAGPWGMAAGGCHPNRDTVTALETAGFRVGQVEAWDERGALLVRPHVLGAAARD
jgi:ubiquinone/menaquinone biosynthesis C-methylase UbiE